MESRKSTGRNAQKTALWTQLVCKTVVTLVQCIKYFKHWLWCQHCGYNANPRVYAAAFCDMNSMWNRMELILNLTRWIIIIARQPSSSQRRFLCVWIAERKQVWFWLFAEIRGVFFGNFYLPGIDKKSKLIIFFCSVYRIEPPHPENKKLHPEPPPHTHTPIWPPPSSPTWPPCATH